MFKASNISKSYGNRLILDDISLSLDKGHSVVVVGSNGVGKSTLLSIFAGYLQADTGTVESEKIGFLPQQDNFFEELNVGDNIAFWTKAAKAKSLPKDFMQLFGVDEYINKKVKTLSGGMKKSVAICCAMVHQPDVLILDEPFVSLDMFYKKNLIQALDKLKKMDKTIIYTSHSLDEIKALNSEIYVLDKGKLNHMVQGELSWEI
ncbi:MAG: ABC transporter ATP-binding protein [Defluviitaleaceae bacterium]|nr:ABC transporter ATP-binding protein [Defluviitaleaceae bacterium]